VHSIERCKIASLMHTRKGLDITGLKVFKMLKSPSIMKQNMKTNSSILIVVPEQNCAHSETHYFPEYTTALIKVIKREKTKLCFNIQEIIIIIDIGSFTHHQY
jgi:hypothetical protein